VAEIEERARSAEGKMRQPYKESAQAKRQFIEPIQQILPGRANHFGFSEIKVKPWNQKYFAFAVGQIKTRTAAVLFRGGASAIVTNVGMGCGGRGSVRRGRDCRAS
jgi:hypothetical protein